MIFLSFFNLPWKLLLEQAGLRKTQLLETIVYFSGCGDFTSTSGVIKSANYPSNYPNNVECTYTIFFPAGKLIALVFDDFSVSNGCERTRLHKNMLWILFKP